MFVFDLRQIHMLRLKIGGQMNHVSAQYGGRLDIANDLSLYVGLLDLLVESLLGSQCFGR